MQRSKNRMSSELVTLRRGASIKGAFFLVVVSTIQLLRAILMPLRLAPLCSCLLQNQPGAYAGRPLIKPLVPGALNLKTLAHNGRYCQLLFLLLILGDKKGVRILKRKTARTKKIPSGEFTLYIMPQKTKMSIMLKGYILNSYLL